METNETIQRLTNRILQLLEAKQAEIRTSLLVNDPEIQALIANNDQRRSVCAEVLYNMWKNHDLMRVWITCPDDSKKGHYRHLASKKGFYAPQELYEHTDIFMPRTELEHIFAHLTNSIQSAEDIATKAYRDQPTQATEIVRTVLDYCVQKQWAHKTKKGYKLSAAVQTLGIEGMETQALLNQVFLDELRGLKGPTTLKEALDAQEKELAQKTVDLNIELSPDPLTNDMPWILFWGEAHIGALLTSLKFQDRALEMFATGIPKELKPSHIITSGMIYGEHKWMLNDLRRTEQESLSRYSWQLAVAMDTIERMKGIRKDESGKVVERLGDKDWYMAEQFAHTVMKAIRQTRYHGIDPATLTLEERRAFMNRDYDQHRKIQYLVVQIYQRRRGGKTLLNEREVEEKIGKRVSEIRLLIETIALLKKGESVPEDYQQVIDMKALDETLNPQKQLDGSYIVTPDNIHFHCGDIRGTVFHYVDHTPKPMKPDPFQTLQERVQNLQLANANPPHVMVAIHPQRLVGQYFPSTRHSHGTLAITTPSLKDLEKLAKGELKGFYEGVREDEAWRQITLRRELTKPGLVMARGGKDNCYQLMLIDEHVLRVMEANADPSIPEVRKRICHVSDTHWGGLPMTPELSIRFMSLALFEMMCEILWFNGDWLHGRNYAQSFHESAKTTLLSMDKQIVFGNHPILMPFLMPEVSPNLEEVTGQDGNHEYNTFGVPLTGWSGIRGAIDLTSALFKGAGRDVTTWLSGNIRVDGDTFKWPYYAKTYCNEYAGPGYTIGMTHNVFPKGKDPQFFSINWFKGLAKFAADLYMLACGDRHHLKFLKYVNTYAFWFGRMCLESGYEWFHGMKGEWMPGIIDISNKRPPIIHLISRDFLEKYQCKDPFFGPIDARGDLTVYSADGEPWIYDSVPFCYSKYINEWLKRVHGSHRIPH